MKKQASYALLRIQGIQVLPVLQAEDLKSSTKDLLLCKQARPVCYTTQEDRFTDKSTRHNFQVIQVGLGALLDKAGDAARPLPNVQCQERDG